MKYILILMLLLTSCDIPNLVETSTTPGTADIMNSDTNIYREDVLNVLGPEEDTTLWIREQDVSVTTDFPAPSWFR